MTQVSGSSKVVRRATVGINTYTPIVDQYALSINGPVTISNGEMVVVGDVAYELRQIVHCKAHPQLAMAFGSPYAVTMMSTTVVNFSRTILSTMDGGSTWASSTVYAGDFNRTSSMLRTGYIYDASCAMCAGDNGLLLYSNDGFQSW